MSLKPLRASATARTLQTLPDLSVKNKSELSKSHSTKSLLPHQKLNLLNGRSSTASVLKSMLPETYTVGRFGLPETVTVRSMGKKPSK